MEEDFPVLDQFFTGYQDAIEEEELLKRGNGYLQEFFPRVASIKKDPTVQDPRVGLVWRSKRFGRHV